MKILYSPNYEIKKNTVVAIGKFDGMHIGHRAVLDILCKEAKKHCLKSTVYTFSKNPKEFLQGEKIFPLMSNDEKNEALEKIGIDFVIYEEFNEKFSNIDAEEFVVKILLNKLNAKEVIMGQNSTFGKGGGGDINLMKKLGEKFGIKVIEVELIKENGYVVSSTKMRKEMSKTIET